RVRAFRVVDEARGRTEATRGDERRDGRAGPAGGTTHCRFPTTSAGRGRGGEVRKAAVERSRHATGRPRATPLGGRQGGAHRPGPTQPAARKISGACRKGGRGPSGEPRPRGASGEARRRREGDPKPRRMRGHGRDPWTRKPR